MSSLPPTSSDDFGAAVATPSAPAAAPLGSRHGERSRREHGERAYSPFLPLLLVVIAGVAWPAFQCFQLVNEKQALATVFGNQIRPFDDSTKLRNSLDAIARDTALLASKGNPGAKLIVDELARRGVTINPSAPPPATDKK
jgi:hypothetical protein